MVRPISKNGGSPIFRSVILIIILAIVVGMLGGLAVVMLKSTINAMELSMLGVFPTYFFLVVRMAGIFIVGAINKYVFKDQDSLKNISHVIFSIAKRSSDEVF